MSSSLPVVLEVVGVEGVAAEAELVEDSVTELGPLVDEQLGLRQSDPSVSFCHFIS